MQTSGLKWWSLVGCLFLFQQETSKSCAAFFSEEEEDVAYIKYVIAESKPLATTELNVGSSYSCGFISNMTARHRALGVFLTPLFSVADEALCYYFSSYQKGLFFCRSHLCPLRVRSVRVCVNELSQWRPFHTG